MKKKKNKKLAILIPVYKESLNLLEQFSVDYLLTKVPGRTLYFVAPEKLDTSYYSERYGSVGFRTFDAEYFSSIVGYNHLLLSADFYLAFNSFDYMLICQTDALVFKDDLDSWMERGFDYIGAPWPNGVEVNLNVGRFSAGNGVNLKSYVGNGGLSLRSVASTVDLLNEFADIRDYWVKCGSSEDLFFAFMGMVSDRYRIPNQAIASRFSLELEPEKYFAINDGAIPTGCHAWWKHDFNFWKKILSRIG